MAKAPSAKQLAARRRFADMVRAKAAARRGGSPARAPSGSFFPTGGIVGQFTEAGRKGLWVAGGKLGTRAISQLVARLTKLDPGANMLLGLGLELGAGWAASLAAERFVGREQADLVLAGTMVGLAETLVRRYNVPFLSTLAGDEGDPLLGWTYEIYPETLPAADLARLAAGAGTAMAMYPGEGMALYQ